MTDPQKTEWKHIVAELISYFCSQRTPPKKSLRENLTIFFGGLGAVAAAITGAIAYEQYSAALNVQRPNIIVESITTEFPNGEGETKGYFPMQFSYKNYGPAPALITGIDIESYVEDKMHSSPNYSNDDKRHMVVPPAIEMHTENAAIQIGSEDKSAVLTGTKKLYIYGVIYYTDVNKQKHHTGFSYRFYPTKKDQGFFSPVGNSSFWQYD